MRLSRRYSAHVRRKRMTARAGLQPGVDPAHLREIDSQQTTTCTMMSRSVRYNAYLRQLQGRGVNLNVHGNYCFGTPTSSIGVGERQRGDATVFIALTSSVLKDQKLPTFTAIS